MTLTNFNLDVIFRWSLVNTQIATTYGVIGFGDKQKKSHFGRSYRTFRVVDWFEQNIAHFQWRLSSIIS
jgi:hypothetical protein